MNLVDSSGWLEYLADGKNAAFFAPPIENTAELMVSTINVYEVFKRVLQQRNEEAALQVAALMQQSTVVDVTPSIAMTAAKVSHELKLPMADSLILVTAREHHATLWTQDADFKGMPNVEWVNKQH